MENNVLCNCGILRQSSQKLTAIYDEALKSSGLRVTQFAVLKNIHKLGKTSITELDTYLEQDRSTIGRNIRILEKIKVVSINKSSDKREFEILITKYGIECLQLARKSWEDINFKISSKLGNVKQKQMIEIMNVIQSI